MCTGSCGATGAPAARRSSPAPAVALERANAAVVRRHLEELRPDVVAWWGMGGMPLSSIEQVRRAGVPAVAFVMDDWLTYQPPGDAWLRLLAGRPRLGRVAERIVGIPTRVDFAGAATYVFVSETLRRQGPPLPRTAVEPSGVDDDFVDPRPPRPWSWRLLSVGRIDPRKGVATAIEALAELPDATLTVAGSGPATLLAELAALAERLGVADRVTFAGAVPRADLPALYEAHDAVVFPVVWEEPWGLVPLEAMASGAPSPPAAAAARASICATGRTASCTPRATRPRSPPRCAGWPATRPCVSGCWPAACAPPRTTPSRASTRRRRPQVEAAARARAARAAAPLSRSPRARP